MKVGRDDTLAKILQRAGADSWQARAMIEAAHCNVPRDRARAGTGSAHHARAVAHAGRQARSRRASRSSPTDTTISSLYRATPPASSSPPRSLRSDEELQNAASDGDKPQTSTLYASFYHAGLMQNIAPETILQILRVHAFDTDFRRRVRPGDTVEMFFDMKDEQSTDGPPGEMLYTAVNRAAVRSTASIVSARSTAKSTTTTRKATTRKSSSCASRCAATTCA